MIGPVSPSQPAPPRKRFGPSPRALAQRRWLLAGAQALLLAVLILLGLGIRSHGLVLVLGQWLLLAVLGWGLWHSGRRALLQPLLERELLLHDQALELRRGAFKRFVVYSSLRHVKVVQGPGERLLSLSLDLEDDSVTLRDLDGLPEAFAAVAGAKPDSAVIEIEERRFDWGEPLPWAGLALLAGLLLSLWLAR
jgi:hypothetical protein